MANPFVWPPIPAPTADGLPIAPPGGMRPDQPPANPNAYNDEMQSALLSPSWTEWDPGNVATWSMDTTRKQLQCVTSTAAGQRVAGLYKSVVPLGAEWSLYAKVAVQCNCVPADNIWFGAGLLCAQDIVTNPATAPFYTVQQTIVPGGNATLYGSTYNFANYALLNAFVDRVGPMSYVRARYVGGVLWADFSADGQSWVNGGSVAVAVNYVGLSIVNYNNLAGRQLTARWSFFRAFTGAGAAAYDPPRIGAYVVGA